MSDLQSLTICHRGSDLDFWQRLKQGRWRDSFDDRGEAAGWAAVAGGEDLPVLQVGYGPFHGGAEPADGLVEVLVGHGSFSCGWLAAAGEHPVPR